VVADDGFKKVASFYENTDYGKGLFDVFAAEVQALGGEMVASEAVLMDQKDFSAIIAKFKAAGPDAVVIFGQYEAAAFWAKQAPDVGLEAPLYGSDGIFAPELITLGGESVNGIRSVSAYTVESEIPFVADFVKAFQDKFGTDPNNGAGYVYDSLLIMLEALDKGGCTREGAKDYMTTSIKDFQGVTGIITFDEDGDRMFQEGLYIKLIIDNGKFVEFKP
jgi:branched-chain amino acid transport system substrate-binding protein